MDACATAPTQRLALIPDVIWRKIDPQTVMAALLAVAGVGFLELAGVAPRNRTWSRLCWHLQVAVYLRLPAVCDWRPLLLGAASEPRSSNALSDSLSGGPRGADYWLWHGLHSLGADYGRLTQGCLGGPPQVARYVPVRYRAGQRRISQTW